MSEQNKAFCPGRITQLPAALQNVLSSLSHSAGAHVDTMTTLKAFTEQIKGENIKALGQKTKKTQHHSSEMCQ